MKNTVIALSALAGAAIAAPLTSVINFDAINSAPSVSLQGAPVAVTAIASYVQSTAVNAASAAVSTAVTVAAKKRGLAVDCEKKTTTSTTSTISTTSKTSSTTSKSSTPVVSVSVSTSTSTSVSISASTSVSTSTSISVATALPVIPTSTQTCLPQPTGAGPAMSPDTTDAFMAYPAWQSAAANAVTPSNYNLVFSAMNNATQQNTYLVYETLNSYDVSGCAAFCDNTALCQSFNIYVERDPLFQQDSANCSTNSTINYKCALFGSSVNITTATNAGQWRGNNFEVLIAGSNGYNKQIAAIPIPDANKGSSNSTWSTGSRCGSGGAISKPGYNVGGKFFPGPFDPAVCAAYAEAQVAINKKSAAWYNFYTYQPCNSFNAYMIKKNKAPVGTYCSLFNVMVSTTAATYQGATYGSDIFEVESSYVFPRKSVDAGTLW